MKFLCFFVFICSVQTSWHFPYISFGFRNWLSTGDASAESYNWIPIRDSHPVIRSRADNDDSLMINHIIPPPITQNINLTPKIPPTKDLNIQKPLRKGNQSRPFIYIYQTDKDSMSAGISQYQRNLYPLKNGLTNIVNILNPMGQPRRQQHNIYKYKPTPKVVQTFTQGDYRSKPNVQPHQANVQPHQKQPNVQPHQNQPNVQPRQNQPNVQPHQPHIQHQPNVQPHHLLKSRPVSEKTANLGSSPSYSLRPIKTTLTSLIDGLQPVKSALVSAKVGLAQTTFSILYGLAQVKSVVASGVLLSKLEVATGLVRNLEWQIKDIKKNNGGVWANAVLDSKLTLLKYVKAKFGIKTAVLGAISDGGFE